MAPSEADELPILQNQNPDNDLKPFFVLHKSTARHSEKKSVGKARTRIDFSVALPSFLERSEEAELSLGRDSQLYDNLRMQAFRRVWSKIDTTIKDVLRNVNLDVFSEIDRWIDKSFGAICSSGMADSNKITCSHPIVTNVTAKQLFTGLVLTRNVEFVDDLQTFADLSLHLKSRGCHVANLSSLDFSAKNGIGLCVRSLLRQFLMVSIDAADLSILASWYSELGNIKQPVIVIIDDIDRCCGSVLSDFILMLSEWAVKIPVILLMGVATTCDAPRSILSSDALHHLSTCKFILGSPADRLDAIIEAVLVKQCSGFTVGHNVATLLRDCFLNHDGTLSSLTRALKMAIVQHFLLEPLSFISYILFDEEGSQVSQSGMPAVMLEAWSKRAFDLPSCRRIKCADPVGEIWSHGMSQMKRMQNLWSSVILCLYEAGKNKKPALLDLYNEALDPELSESMNSDCSAVLESDMPMPSGNQLIHGQHLNLPKGGSIGQAIRQVVSLMTWLEDVKRYCIQMLTSNVGVPWMELWDLPAAALCQLLERWEKLTSGVNEIHEKVKELQSLVNFDGEKRRKREFPDASKRHAAQSNASIRNDAKALNEKVVTLIHCMIREYMQPIESIPFHEIVCFKNVDKLQSALVGDPRRRIQVDLLESHKFLKCSCCHKSCNIPLPSVHDTSIMYTLAQEHGDLINLHDWYQSFKAIILHPNNKGKNRSKQLPSPKKRKHNNEPPNETEALIQARFCRAVIELQITGLLRLPSKRRPDYVQRVAFGL